MKCAGGPPLGAPENAFLTRTWSPRPPSEASGTYSDRAIDLNKSVAPFLKYLYSHFGVAVLTFGWLVSLLGWLYSLFGVALIPSGVAVRTVGMTVLQKCTHWPV